MHLALSYVAILALAHSSQLVGCPSETVRKEIRSQDSSSPLKLEMCVPTDAEVGTYPLLEEAQDIDAFVKTASGVLGTISVVRPSVMLGLKDYSASALKDWVRHSDIAEMLNADPPMATEDWIGEDGCPIGYYISAWHENEFLDYGVFVHADRFVIFSVEGDGPADSRDRKTLLEAILAVTF